MKKILIFTYNEPMTCLTDNIISMEVDLYNLIYSFIDENTKITYMRDKNSYSRGRDSNMLNKIREKKHSAIIKNKRFDNFRFLQETVHVSVNVYQTI